MDIVKCQIENFFTSKLRRFEGEGGLLFAANFGQNKEMFWVRKYFILMYYTKTDITHIQGRPSYKNTLYFLFLFFLENISFAFLYDDVCVKVFNRIVTFPLLQVGRTQNEQYTIYLEMSNIQFWLKRIPSIRVSFCHHRCFSSHNSLRGIHCIHPSIQSTPTFC